MDRALDLLSQIRGVTWSWAKPATEHGKLFGSPDSGVLAQDVEKVLPGLVHVDDTGTKYVNYAGLVGVLVEAVRELNAKVRALEARP